MIDELCFLILGFFAWFVGSLAAGGSGLIFVVGASFLLPMQLIPIMMPVIASVSGAYRVFLYYRDIHFGAAKWFLLGVILGSLAGTQLFVRIANADYTGVIEGTAAFVLIVGGLYNLFRPSKDGRRLPLWFLSITSFISSLVGSISGAVGPISNFLFLRSGLKPRQIIGTKSFCIFIGHAMRLVFYGMAMSGIGLKALEGRETQFASALVFALIGACAGAYVSSRYLDHIDPRKFSKIVNIALIVFGLYFALRSAGVIVINAA